ncbi:DUF1707 and FHA domain-containing protein [Streptomyces sp. NBC_01803]|uniref:DUF1707 and FHA domain-containing protein n=1 Tax=Streptomyces sp. NBC_01803 TaxID=2975946 RepID=UPI002DDBE57A|nr:DUF1707 and FHA domain-containing protein [Streptomyces sp. NBC_01803]WSA43780.1 FHA domain-containing protein [Streptomyces sp. NBC_01803]
MASVEFSAHSPRISDADRERALDVLREGVVEGRVSQETFLHRVEVIMSARVPDELVAVLHDLPARQPPPAPRAGWFVGSLTRLAAFRQRARMAWRAERLPQLLLPAPAQEALSIGRAPGCGLRLSHAGVSRHHATLRGTGTGWLLTDLGSANGTWVNGHRVAGTVPVGPGDQVRFGAVSFRLAVVIAGR